MIPVCRHGRQWRFYYLYVPFVNEDVIQVQPTIDAYPAYILDKLSIEPI